mgnify:CR=1 FL=1
MSKAVSSDEESLLKVELNPGGKLHTDHAPQRRILGVPASLFAGGLYCLASMGMVLLNKVRLGPVHTLHWQPWDLDWQRAIAAQASRVERRDIAMACPQAALSTQASHLWQVPRGCLYF